MVLVFVQSKQTEIDVFKLATLKMMKIIHMTLLDFLLLIMAPFWAEFSVQQRSSELDDRIVAGGDCGRSDGADHSQGTLHSH